MTDANLRARAPFSASDAAFAGFGIIQRRPSTILVWGGLMLVFSLITQFGMVMLVGPQMQAFRALAPATAQTNPALYARMFAGMIPFGALAIAAFVVLFGVINAAVSRAVLRPEEGGPGYLAFGADELRQIAVIFLWFLLFIGVYIAIFIVSMVLIGVSVGIAAAARNSPGLAAVIGSLGVIAVILAAFCALIWLGVRLSLALPLTFDTRQIHLFRSFALTRGRFWSLFGAYFLSWIIGIAISLAYLVVLAVVAAVLGGGLAGMGQLFQRDTSSLAALFTPLVLISLIGGAFIQALQWALIAGAPAGAYAQLRPNRLAEVF